MADWLDSLTSWWDTTTSTTTDIPLYTELDAAVTWATDSYGSISRSNGWTSAQISAAAQAITWAKGYGSDGRKVANFWVALVKAWETNAQTADGWDTLGGVWAEQANITKDYWGIVDDTGVVSYASAVGTGLSDAAQSVEDAANPRKSWIPWAVGAGLGLWALREWRR